MQPDKFRLLAGADELVKTKPAKDPGGFCKHCGVYPFAAGDAAEWNQGDYVSINIAALDGIDHATLAALPITYLDGLHDTWAPLEHDVAHL